MSTTNWFVTAGGREQGPFTAEQIKDLARTGKLKPDMPIRKDGMDRTVPAATVQGLFGPPTARSAKPTTGPTVKPAPSPAVEPLVTDDGGAVATDRPRGTARHGRGTARHGRGTARHGRGTARHDRRDDDAVDNEDDDRRSWLQGTRGLILLGVTVVVLLVAAGAIWYFGQRGKISDLRGTWELDLVATADGLIAQMPEGAERQQAQADVDKMKQAMAQEADLSFARVVIGDTSLHLVGMMTLNIPVPFGYTITAQRRGQATLQISSPARGNQPAEVHTLTVALSGNRASIELPVSPDKLPAAFKGKVIRCLLVFVKKNNDTTPPAMPEGGLFGLPGGGSAPPPPPPADVPVPAPTPAPTPPAGVPAPAAPPATAPAAPPPAEPPADRPATTGAALSPDECRDKAQEIYEIMESSIGEILGDSRRKLQSKEMTKEAVATRAQSFVQLLDRFAVHLQNPGFATDPALAALRDKLALLVTNYREYLGAGIADALEADASGVAPLGSNERLKQLAEKAGVLKDELDPLFKAAGISLE
jgi:hypothetical protein